MKIKTHTELMKNQKHAEVMSPDIAFEVLQTSTGEALFFSIGTDKVFYLTRELPSTSTGWRRLDLSSPLSTSNGGAKIQAKSFDLSQNPATGLFDVALIVTINGSDVLYMTRGHSSDPADWQKPITWTKLPFDAKGIQAPSPLQISDVYLMNIPSVDDPKKVAVQNCFVDVIRTPGNPLQLLDRYYVKPDAPTKWATQGLKVDLKANSISSCLGLRSGDSVPGIYTYGQIENVSQLMYQPQHNEFRPDRAGAPATLSLPSGASAIVSAPDQQGGTNLFVAASGGLYLFSSDNLDTGATPALVVPAVKVGKYGLFDKVSSIAATTINSKTVVWLLNAQGNLSYTECLAGSEQTPGAWSSPMLFCSNVENFAFYVNNASSNIVLFAHLSSQDVLQFTQDATGRWTKRDILLPPTDPNDYVEFNSFTTHVKVTDDHNVAKANVPVELTSDIPVAVYANNAYHLLSSDVPIVVKTDVLGAVTIIQVTTSISGAKITVTLAENNSITSTTDPSATPMSRLNNISKGSDLDKVQLKDSQGKTRPLIPDGISAKDKDTVAASISKLVKAKKSLPGGSAPTSKVASAAGLKTRKAMSFQAKSVGATSIGKTIAVEAGDLFETMKTAWNDFEHGVVEFADNAWHFTVKIGDLVYKAVLDTVSAVFQAVEAVFNKIKVFLEDLIAWLGYLFEWDDFVRTHTVIKHVLKGKANDVVNMIGQLENAVEDVFIQLEDHLNALTGVTDPGETMGTHLDKSNSKSLGSDSAQSQWATHHTKNGMSGTTIDRKGPAGSDVITGILNDLEKLLVQEVDAVKTTVTQVKEQVLDPYTTLTPIEIMKRLIGILGDLILKTARNVIVKVLDIAKILLKGIVDLLDAPIDIPIIAPLYKFFAKSDLTVLDVCCLMAAIPATIGFKIAAGQAPFPDDSSVDSAKAAVNAKQKERTAAQTQYFQSIKSQKSTSSAKKAVLPIKKATQSVKKVITSLKKPTSNVNVGPSAALNRQVAASKKSKHTWGAWEIVVWVLYFIALPSSLGIILTSTLNWTSDDHNWGDAFEPGVAPAAPPAWGAICFAFYLGFCAPNYFAWHEASSLSTILNDIITAISIAKCAIDNGMPSKFEEGWKSWSLLIDFGINGLWLIPAGWAFLAGSKKPIDFTFLAANICFDLGGIVAPWTNKKADAEIAPWAFGIQQFLNGSYGLLCYVSTWLWTVYSEGGDATPST